jgi:hypothetical protein
MVMHQYGGEVKIVWEIAGTLALLVGLVIAFLAIAKCRGQL